jgi:uncharacterized protein
VKQAIFFGMFILFMSFSYALPVEEVKLNDYVMDYANIISPSQEEQIRSITKSLHNNNIAQIAVVTVNDFNGLSKEEYALEITHENLGDLESDNGLLILVGLDVHEYRIEVGYGLEGDLNDAKVGRYGREILVPYFESQEYGQGIFSLVEVISYELNPDGFSQPPKDFENVSSNYSSSNIWFFMIIVFFIIRAISYSYYNKKKNKEINNDDVEDAFSAALIASWFFRPPRGGSGGLGGFGGFGGGGFGGGGAGGGW